MKARRRLRDLAIREIALCREGMHPGARIMLYKKRDGKPVTKTEDGEEPRGFRDHLESSRLMEIDSALDRRLHALLATTTEIMRADVSDREERVLAAVEEYAATMQRDVPELFAGRLAKWLNEWAGESQPSDDDVCAIVKSELGLAGLLPDEPSGGKVMQEFLKSLSERGRAALALVLGDRDPAEFFKGASEDVGKLVVGLLEKAAEWGPRIDTLEAELEKAKTPAVDPTSLESILKSVEDPVVKALIESQAATNKELGGMVADLQKAALRKGIDDFAKSLDALPDHKKIGDLLEKAHYGNFADQLKEIFTAANVAAQAGKILKELGVETTVGDAAPTADPGAAHAMLVAKAAEIRKALGAGNISDEKAYEMACEQNGDLYQVASQSPAVQH